MHRFKKKEIEWLAFEHLSQEKGLIHGVFLRHGGVSHGPFCSLNVGSRAGDEIALVEENIHRVAKALDVNELCRPLQMHGDQVIEVNRPSPLSCDGLITKKPNLGLMIQHADCQAAIFYDPVQKAIGCVHSGWRGSVQNIYKNCIRKMEASFGTRPADLLVGISPSLGPLAAEFRHYTNELPPTFWPFQLKETYFDFWAISTMQLIECGVLKQNIEIARICTYSNHDDFFSYRREKKSGRHATLVALQE